MLRLKRGRNPRPAAYVPLLAGILELVPWLKATWFRELVVRQARRTKDEMLRLFGEAKAAPSANHLEMFAAALEDAKGREE